MPTKEIVDKTIAVRWGGKDLVLPRGGDLKNFIIDYDCCFLCNKNRSRKNKEHVIPKWLIKECSLNATYMHLPQGMSHPVSTYKVPICKECNTILGRELEVPVSQAFKMGFEQVDLMARSRDPRLYAWMSFLYLKTHYKDMFVRNYKRSGVANNHLGADIDWSKFSNAHSIVRAFTLGIGICPTAIGSLKAIRIKEDLPIPFMYKDNLEYPCNFIRVKDVAVICSFNDLGAAGYYLRPYLERLDEPSPYLQAASLYNEYILANLRLYGQWDLAHDFFYDGSVKIVGCIGKPIGVRQLPGDLRSKILEQMIIPFALQVGLSKQTIRALVGGVRLGSVAFLPDFALQSKDGHEFPVRWQRGQDLLPMERIAGADQDDSTC